MSADAPMSTAPTPAAEQAARGRGRLIDVHDPEMMIWGWSLRLLRAGVALLVGFEIAYFVLDHYIPPPLTAATTALHAGAVTIAVLLLALTTSKWFERNWRAICFATVLATYGLTLALRLLCGDSEPLFITLALTLVGAAALVPWSMGWQAALGAGGLVTIGVSVLTPASVDSEATYRSLGVVAAIILGHLTLSMRERYRAELSDWIDSLRSSHQELSDALARSATVMTERELAEGRLREGEAMLRKVFDAAPDNLAITRMSDGATLEVNREFLKTGYTREEVLGFSTAQLGRWSRSQLRELVNELRIKGTVRNFEAELRNKDGRLLPTLVSATMVELGGEQCVISMGRDITELKKTQHELTAAREALSVELRELEERRRQLISSEDKLRKVLEATGDTITISRLKDGHYLDVNQAFCDITGYTREETLGRSALEMGLWAYPDQLWNLLRLLKTDGRVRNLQCTFHLKDGRLVEHLVSVSLIKVDGETCMVGATRDVSELKRNERELIAVREALSAEVRELETSQARLRDEVAERELAQRRVQQSEQSLRKIFETSLDTITIKRVSDGRYVDVNKEFEVFGYSRAEALGKNAEELGIWADPRQLEAFSQRLKLDGRVRNIETLCRTRDGRIIPSLISAVTIELSGEPSVVSFVRDISHLKQTERELMAAHETLTAQVNELSETQEHLRAEIAERELAQRRLQESEQTLRRIFEASLDSITIKRLSDGRYIDVNKAFEVTGYTREEALGKTDEDLGLWADHAHETAVFEKIRAESQIRNVEADFHTRGGHTLSALVSSAVVELGSEPCVVSITRDISRLKQTERELIAAREAALAASEAKSHFLSVMSHEIRTPMNAILGMADLLWETALNPEQRRYLDTIRNNSASLLNLVNGILDLSKVESGRLILEHADFDLVELAEDVMETLGVRAHEKGLELALRIPRTFPTALTGDPLRLRQILINLLGNAIKFTEHGEVTLTIEAADRAQPGESPAAPPKPEGAAASADAGSPVGRQLLRFAVRDTGIGIPAERQQAIFSNFIQADSTVSRKYGGSGLGLAIVKRLVELMNGKVTLESRPREGSTFSFSVALELQPAATARSPSLEGMARLAGKRVLVADHSPASRAMLAELLAMAGAEVAVAADGTDALGELARTRAAGQPYDAVVADNRMPEPQAAAIA